MRHGCPGDDSEESGAGVAAVGAGYDGAEELDFLEGAAGPGLEGGDCWRGGGWGRGGGVADVGFDVYDAFEDWF